jgi:hypothetical protein
MDVEKTEAFARSLMREVWETFDPEAVPRFYHRNVVGHHRAQTLNYQDPQSSCLGSETQRSPCFCHSEPYSRARSVCDPI